MMTGIDTGKTYLGLPMWICWVHAAPKIGAYAISSEPPTLGGVFLDQSSTIIIDEFDAPRAQWSNEEHTSFNRLREVEEIVNLIADKPRPSYNELCEMEVEGW